MNSEIIYKGVTIVTVRCAAVGAADSFVYIAIGKEYSTIAAAKGAITRWVNANVEAVQKQEEAPAIAFTDAKNDKGEPIAANPKTAQVYAELDYFGMAKARDTRSRNKREGKYAFKTPKRYMMHMQTREQRAPRHNRGVMKFGFK